MAKSVQSRLTKLSNEYSANVKKVRELEAAKKKPFVTDAEVKNINNVQGGVQVSALYNGSEYEITAPIIIGADGDKSNQQTGRGSGQD